MSILTYFYLLKWSPFIASGLAVLNLFLLVGFLRARRHARKLALRNGYLHAMVNKRLSHLLQRFDQHADAKTAIQRRDAANDFVDAVDEFLVDLERHAGK